VGLRIYRCVAPHLSGLERGPRKELPENERPQLQTAGPGEELVDLSGLFFFSIPRIVGRLLGGDNSFLL
jgi:hypothetical protein